MKKYILVTGGAGFVGSNLIESLLLRTNLKIISLDNYSSGTKKNHIKDKRVKYIKGNTKLISKILKDYREKINAVFHFGEFSRIYQSFVKLNECIDSNTIGTHEVFSFCMKNKIKLIYSATSASLGNHGDDKNLSPYAFSKAKNLEMLENLKKWFGFKFEIIYFYNVYGKNQICSGDMATVIGIFENAYLKKKPLPVVRPGTQTRRFTHIKDTVDTCYFAWKQNKNRHYSISSRNEFSIIEIAKLFQTKIKFLPRRRGERYASALTKMNLSNKVHRKYGKIKIRDYIDNFINNN
ncbi:NAD-dependent epimerase/dehydratase family protein [Candidatus Pelagibacter sp.]|uniref:NAD-dependent epimerase/dehydratase family protein n=1 Tax=Candidatus Pelagibacter sp. TaxID=2024849 RepID=UPI003F8469EF